MSRKFKISVIIPSKNNGDTIEQCIKSVLSAEYEDKEVIVVDAHSQDRTKLILEKYRHKIKVVYDEGKGIGASRNLGVIYSKGEIICFVDADAFVSRNHFKRIVEAFKKDENCLLYTSPSPRDRTRSRMPSSA